MEKIIRQLLHDKEELITLCARLFKSPLLIYGEPERARNYIKELAQRSEKKLWEFTITGDYILGEQEQRFKKILSSAQQGDIIHIVGVQKEVQAYDNRYYPLFQEALIQNKYQFIFSTQEPVPAYLSQDIPSRNIKHI